MPFPIFTVILTTYNRAELLGRAISSVLGQTFVDFELFIIDDSSTDQTPEVVARFNDPRLEYIRQPSNGGVSLARNTGIARAHGTLIAFLDDDDTIEPTFLAEVYAAFMQAPPRVAFWWTWKVVSTPTPTGVNTSTLYTYDLHDGKPLPGSDFLGKLRAGGSGLVVRATAIHEVGGFDPAFRTHEDADFLLRLAERFDYVVIPQPLYTLYEHRGARLTDRSVERTRIFELITERHYTTFKRYPRLLGSRYHAIGRDYFRFGNRRAGRKYQWKAIQTQPLNLSYWLELLLLACLSYMPNSVQRRVWHKSQHV